MRTIQLLNDNWRFVRSADSPEEAAQAAGAPVTLPHTWNAEDGQDGGNDYYRGRCWYVRPLSVPAPAEAEQVWLQVDGAAMTADVYLNGRHLAHHEGGYSTFRVELTPFLRGEDTLAVAVDNSDNDRVYPQKADFTFYGGLYRDVSLLTVPAAHFALSGGVPGLRVTPEVVPDLKSAAVTVEAQVENGEGRTVTFTVAGMRQSAVVQGGAATARFTLCPVRLWDGTADPYLYTATAALDSGDAVSARFGCRRFAVDPQQGFLLNGRPYPLRGVSRHQDRKGVGSALTSEMHREDMEILREIGANTVRLAHYQHAQAFYDLCDENGIVAWAEIPFITMYMENGRENTLSQMRELVTQCYNHPSIVCWGLSNEITAASAVNEALLENHRALNDLCHSLDKTRPTTMANVFMLETDSPILEIPDINSYNLYFGWYLGDLEQNDEFFDEYHANYPDRAIGLSEYGADANPAYQSAHPEQGDYTEGFQCVYHEHLVQMIEKRPWLWATHVWNLFDFAADGRDEGGKHGENQKGLVTFDRKTKKDAFYLYKAYWNKSEPFVHLCGSRYVDRTEAVTEVTAYSNQNAVALLVDGKQFATLEGSHIFKFAVPISGSHTIEARAGDCTSVILVRHVDVPNPDYTLPGRQGVTNWFDAGETNPACFSVDDKLSVLQSDPRAGEIVNRMMSQGASSRGDVADAVKDNPGLLRMMGRMTLLSLLKQGGAEEAQVQQLNRVLQTIPKPEQPEE
ncbi:MAG: glycoside hydrolase family 2 protein [Clostridiales bacterium]|nr:glycoside hydrolase family 2 protein [Clostridiales bacterium]